jgi:hypothetical protein
LLAAAWAGAVIESALPGAAAPWFAACEVLAAVLRGIAHAASNVPGALLATGSEPGIPGSLRSGRCWWWRRAWDAVPSMRVRRGHRHAGALQPGWECSAS